MKTPYLLSKKGWKLYSNGNALATYSSLLVVFTSLVAALIIVMEMTMDEANILIPVICAAVVIVFNLIAVALIFVGRLLHWKGLTLLLGASQITDAVVGQEFASEDVVEETEETEE